jgi:archaemetzincin
VIARGSLLALLLMSAMAHAQPARHVVYVQPLGAALPDADVTMVRAALTGMYGIEVSVLPRVSLPDSAYYSPRARYRAEKILSFLDTLLPVDGARILGLTAVDISTTKGDIEDWGVLGLGEMPGVSGVISSFRCHKRARSTLQARERLAKVAVHEIGHTLGLPHCPTRGCLMQDAEGSVLSTDHENDLCERCRAQLTASGRTLPQPPQLPWRPAR